MSNSAATNDAQLVTAINSPAFQKSDDSVKPSSRESRIQARRVRIEHSHNLHSNSDKDPSNGSRFNQNPYEAKEDKPITQMKASKQKIINIKRKGIENVSQVKVVAIQRETMRRSNEYVRAGVISAKAKKTLDTCEDIDNQIQQSWNKCEAMSHSLGTPYAFHEMLLSQRALCKELLNAKETLLMEYNSELKRKDDEYVKELKRQADEIDTLLQKMDQQYTAFKKSLLEEFIHIEQEFMTDRSEKISSNVKEIEELFISRKESESRYLEERSKRIDDNVEALENLRIQDAEAYNLVKIKLETDVQKLEQQLQQMKATYQLNAEKLEYNYQVLKKRDDENSITIKQQKRRITRMTDLVNNLKVKLVKQEKNFLSEHSDLQQDFNRISSQYKELAKKFKHFQVNGEIKFNELWEMNQETIRTLVAKVLMADVVIHQQQLGIPQEPMELPEPWSITEEIGNDSVKNHNVIEYKSVSPMSEEQGNGANTSKSHLTASGDSAMTKPISVLLVSSKNAIVQHILEMLSTEATFLLDQKMARLLIPLPSADRSLLKIDTILRALNVGSGPDLVQFLQLFLLPDFHHSAANLAENVLNGGSDSNVWSDNPEKSPSTVNPQAMLISPNLVTKVLTQYLKKTDHARSDKLKSTKCDSNLLGNSQNGMSTDSDKKVGGSGKQNWDQILTMLNSKRFKNWDIILQSMNTYHSLLSARHELVSEVIDLETQNAELKNLLREYMSATVNKSLQVPPSQVILSQIQQHQQKQSQQTNEKFGGMAN